MKSLFRGNFFYKAAPALAVLLFSFAAPAQTISEVQKLRYGTIVLFDFNVVAQITVHANTGGFNDNGNMYFITDPQRGIYDLTGGPPNAAFTIILPGSTNVTGPGGGFVLDNFTSWPAGPSTDGAGDATFYVGARMTSTGGGVNYSDGNYNGTFNIQVAF